MRRRWRRRRRFGERVTFTGHVTDEALTDAVRERRHRLRPSRYESHGIVLVEAMMFGAAIVTCDAGGIREVVQDERTALVVPPDDVEALTEALRRAVTDGALRARLGAAGARDLRAALRVRGGRPRHGRVLRPGALVRREAAPATLAPAARRAWSTGSRR